MTKGKLTQAYPNYDQYLNFSAPRDTEKWISSVKDMYSRIHNGADRLAAFNDVTSGWDNMEKLEFTHWLKYYEENTHKKYSSEPNKAIKIAQVNYWEDINRAGYFVPIHKDPTIDTNKVDAVPAQIDFAVNPELNPTTIENDKRELIEAIRNKILGRLGSAEKLLGSRDGHLMAGDELVNLMRAIYDLKERIHVVNIKKASTKVYEDMIVRAAHGLNKQGFVKASGVLYKIADDVELTPTPTESPAAATTNRGPGTLPGEGPGLTAPPSNPPTSPPATKSDKEPISKGMEEFLDGLNDGGITTEESSADDELEVQDTDDELIVEAQMEPVKPDLPEEDIEVNDPEPDSSTKNFDAIMDQALSNVTVADVVNKLEDLAKIFKTREVPRQLAFVDMMLDRLGLASYFPTLSEASNRSLDSNQYILSRVEEILSKLRGSLKTRDIDLKNENVITNPEVENVKRNLQDAELKEKNRKELRKKVEDEALTAPTKITPEIEVEEDLGKPAEMTNKIPAPVKPPAPIMSPPATPIR